MLVSLDQEQWQTSDDATVMEVLADVSDRAAARRHVVTSLHIGGRVVTDRELQPQLLARNAKDVGAIVAVSQPATLLFSELAATAVRLGAQLKAEGAGMIGGLRIGVGGWPLFDAWVGRLADYLEACEAIESRQSEAAVLAPWIDELIRGREQRDAVRVADLLQYEVVPRLPDSPQGPQPITVG